VRIQVRYRTGFHGFAGYNRKDLGTMETEHTNIKSWTIKDTCLWITYNDDSVCIYPLTSIVRFQVSNED